MTENVFNIIEDFLGTKLTARSLKKLSKLDHKQIIELHDRIKFFYRLNYWFVDSGGFPQISQDEVRYAVLTDRSGQMDSDEIWNNPDNLKKLLLYYPAIAVLDPIDEILSLAAEHPPILADTLSRLLPIRTLIDQDIIRLVPGPTATQAIHDQIEIAPFLGHVLQDDKVIKAIRLYTPENYDAVVDLNMDLPGFMLSAREKAAIEPFVRKTAPPGLVTLAAMVIKEVYTQFLVADLSDSNMALVSEKHAQFHSRLFGITPDVFPRLGKIDGYVAPFMLSLALPRIHNISWQDIVAIRQKDEDFYFWREALKRVMKDSYKPDNLSNAEFFNNAKETLSARLRILRRSMEEKLSLKGKILDAWIPAGIGFVGGMLTGSIEIALGEAALTGSLSLLYSLFVKRPSKSEQALYRHFTVFIDK